MAFIAEDGTGLANANALTDVAFADAYFADRAVSKWAGTAAVKQAAIVRATDYIETRWSCRFKGERQFPEVQALSFPRLCINADDVVPVGIQKAAAEYALRALTAPLAPDPVVDKTGRAVKSSKRRVGPIETDVTYMDGAGVVHFCPYPMADGLVAPYLRAASGTIRN